MKNIETICICCGKSTHVKLAESIDPVSMGDVIRCQHCNLTWVYPLPSDEVIAKAYDGFYKSSEDYDKIDLKMRKRIRGAFRGYKEMLDGLEFKNWRGRFLDLGGGMGYYSDAAQELGFEVTLLDIDKESTSFAQKNLGIKNIFTGPVEQFNPETKFDVVFCRHVIEHYKSPETLIASASRLLNDNGLLIIETPNNNSISAFQDRALLRMFRTKMSKVYKGISDKKLIEDRLYALRPPIHIFSFRIPNLILLAERFDFSCIKSFTYKIGDKTFWPGFEINGMEKVWNRLISGNIKGAANTFVSLVKQEMLAVKEPDNFPGMGIVFRKNALRPPQE